MVECVTAKFHLGQVVFHKMLDSRCVVIDVDPTFQGSEELFGLMSTPQSLRSKPWYYVLIDDTDSFSYVSEDDLCVDASGLTVDHPQLATYFEIGSDQRRMRCRMQ